MIICHKSGLVVVMSRLKVFFSLYLHVGRNSYIHFPKLLQRSIYAYPDWCSYVRASRWNKLFTLYSLWNYPQELKFGIRNKYQWWCTYPIIPKNQQQSRVSEISFFNVDWFLLTSEWHWFMPTECNTPLLYLFPELRTDSCIQVMKVTFD